MVKVMDWMRSISTGRSPLQEGPGSDDERQRSSRKSSLKGSSSGSSDLEIPGTWRLTAASLDKSIEPNSPKPASAPLIEASEEAEKQTVSIVERLFPGLDPSAFNNEDEILTESQHWSDGQTGPFTREKFLTIKKLIDDDDYKRFRHDKFELLKRTDERNDLCLKLMQAEIAKECLAQKLEAEKDELKAEIADIEKDRHQCRATASLLESTTPAQIIHLKNLLEKASEQVKQLQEHDDKEAADRRKRRGPPRKAVFTSDNIDNDRAIPPFLYDNPADNAIELQINKLLLTTEQILRTKEHSWQNLVQADQYTHEAYEESVKLNYVPMEARCAFWKGRVAYAAKDYDAAVFAFRASRRAFGSYFEGLYCEDWIDASRAKKKKRAEILKERQADGISDDAPWPESEAEDESEPENEEEKPHQRPKPKAGYSLPNPNRSSILVSGKSFASDSVVSSRKGLDDVEGDHSMQSASASARWRTANDSDTSSQVSTALTPASPGSSRSRGGESKVTLANELEDMEMGEGDSDGADGEDSWDCGAL